MSVPEKRIEGPQALILNAWRRRAVMEKRAVILLREAASGDLLSGDCQVIMGIAPEPRFPQGADEPSPPPFPYDPSGGQDVETKLDPSSPTVIMLVEDNPPDVYMIDRVLKHSGIPMDLRVASDGEQALAMLRRFEEGAGHPQPSLILLDWNLPGVSGAEVLTYARQTERWRNVPVVVVTSSNSPMDIREIARLGATAHFRKPTDLDAYLDLKRVVLEMLPKPPQAPS